jgi:hypothetical protein
MRPSWSASTTGRLGHACLHWTWSQQLKAFFGTGQQQQTATGSGMGYGLSSRKLQSCRGMNGVIITPLVQARLLQCTSLSLCLSTRLYIYILFKGRYSIDIDQHRSVPTTTGHHAIISWTETEAYLPRLSKKHHVDANPTRPSQEQRTLRRVVHLRPSRPTPCEKIPRR